MLFLYLFFFFWNENDNEDDCDQNDDDRDDKSDPTHRGFFVHRGVGIGVFDFVLLVADHSVAVVDRTVARHVIHRVLDALANLIGGMLCFARCFLDRTADFTHRSACGVR